MYFLSLSLSLSPAVLLKMATSFSLLLLLSFLLLSFLPSPSSSLLLPSSSPPPPRPAFLPKILLSLALLSPLPAAAISGGGLDFAQLDITSSTEFANKSFKGKDFSQVIAKGTSFQHSNLQGTRFIKAFLVNTDFSFADLRGASLEDTSLDGAIFEQADLRGAYFSRSLEDAGSLKGANFEDVSLPPKLLPILCERSDVGEKNEATG